MKKLLTMMLLLAATISFYSCSSDDDDSPLLELTVENIAGYWYWESDDEYASYQFYEGYGSYYYENDNGYVKNESFTFRIEGGGSALYITTASGTNKYQITELRRDRVTIETTIDGQKEKHTFIRDDYDDDYDDDDDDYEENIPEEIPQPVPPTGEGTKIIGTWGNPTFISSSDPEDWEDNVVSNSNATFTFYADGTAYFYDGEDPEDSFEFIYEYKHNENTLMMYCGRYGQIVSKRTIVFEHDNKMIMRDDYYFDPTEDAVPEYSDVTYSLKRVQ